MSSLQRAITTVKQSMPQYETSNGAFETCFAGGLDLSEFSSANEGSSSFEPGKSAAAELLRVKAEERKQKEQEEAAELEMEEAIKKRVSLLEQALKTPRPSNNIVADVLVKMHGNDTSQSDTSYRRKKSGRKNNPSSSKTQPTGMKQQSFKKSRRTKY